MFSKFGPCSLRHPGFMALIGVLILGIVGVSISISVLSMGSGASRASFALEQGKQTESLLQACIEEAFSEIRVFHAFEGEENFLLGQGNCWFKVAVNGGESRTVSAMATIDSVDKRAEVLIDTIDPQINVISWKEVDNF